MTRWTRVIAMAAFLVACSKSEPQQTAASAGASTTATANASTSTCTANGLWAKCSVMYRLERSGVTATVDSSDTKPEEPLLGGQMFVVKLGQNSRLELYLYPDEAARVADAKRLDRSKFVNDTAQQTIKRERTLIESANLIGLLSSLSSHQRQRVSDALTAGPPQPASR